MKKIQFINKKMNLFIFVILLVISLPNLALTTSTNPLLLAKENSDRVASHHEQQKVQHSHAQPSLSDVLSLVLKDPEYLSMSDFDQYMVLMSLYTAVQNVINERRLIAAPNKATEQNEQQFGEREQQLEEAVNANKRSSNLYDRLRFAF